MNTYIGMMMDEFEEEDRLRRANDLAIARMLWDDAAVIPREFVTSSGTAPIAQGSSRTAAALSALRGGDDLVDETGGQATREPARASTADIGRARLFISRTPLMVGPEDPVIDDGYGHPSMDDVGRIYNGNNPVQVTPPAPRVAQAPTPPTGPSTAPQPFHIPNPPIGQNFAPSQRPADQPFPPLIQSSSGVQASNQYSHWQQSRQQALSMPGILNISPPNQNFPPLTGPLMIPPPLPQPLERAYSQNAPPRPMPVQHQSAPGRHRLDFPFSYTSVDHVETTAPASTPIRIHSEPAPPQFSPGFNNRHSFRAPLPPRPIPLETNASIPNGGNSNPMNPALDPYTIMVRNANQHATQNASQNASQNATENAINDPFAHLFNNFNNHLDRTQQNTNTNTATFSPTMWGTPLFPQPPVPTPVQPPPLPPTPTPLPPPIITQPGNPQPSAPFQPPVQPPIQHTMQHTMQHPMQHPMQPPIQPPQPLQNPHNLRSVPLPPQIIPETTNRTTPQTSQLTPLPPPPIIPPTTIMPNPPLQRPPSQVPVSQAQPFHTTISYSDHQAHATEKVMGPMGVEGGKRDLTVLVGLIPFLGIAGLVFYAFSNVGVLILAGVIVWYTYWLPASGHGAKSK